MRDKEEKPVQRKDEQKDGGGGGDKSGDGKEGGRSCLNISQRPTAVLAEVPGCVISFSVSLLVILPFFL